MSEKKCRDAVRERSGELCEICLRRAAHMHHRKNRSQGGLWTPSNILHLCARCHGVVTEAPKWACQQGYSVRSYDNPADVPVYLVGRGVCRLSDDGVVEVTN